MRRVNTLSFWWDGPATGPENMAADEELAAEAERRGSPLLRFYGWSATTVSLGGFQRITEAEGIEAIRGRPLVRRPSGGGAIVHGSDLTYAAAVPKSHPWGATPQAFYDALHGALVETLAHHGIRAWLHPADDGERGDDLSAADAAGFFCFDRRATGDLIMPGPGPAGGSKILGSAQRRRAGVVLQHGSLLMRGNVAVGTAARHPGIEELHVGQRVPEPADLAGEWCRRIAAVAGMTLDTQQAPFLRGREQAIAAAACRFRDERWTARR